MNLYEIDKEILSCVDIETGEIFDAERFEKLAMTRDAKIENICLWIKNLKAQAEALKTEKDSFAQRQKAVETKLESLKKYISGYLEGTPFESARVKVSFRKSKSVEIMEGAVIPDEYLRFKEPEVNKAEIKMALEKGLKIAGVSVVENYNIQIK